MQILLKVDGRECRAEIGSSRAGWCDVFEIGPTLSGRMARVARYSLPDSVLDHGGKVRTGGHVFEVPRNA